MCLTSLAGPNFPSRRFFQRCNLRGVHLDPATSCIQFGTFEALRRNFLSLFETFILRFSNNRFPLSPLTTGPAFNPLRGGFTEQKYLILTVSWPNRSPLTVRYARGQPGGKNWDQMPLKPPQASRGVGIFEFIGAKCPPAHSRIKATGSSETWGGVVSILPPSLARAFGRRKLNSTIPLEIIGLLT